MNGTIERPQVDPANVDAASFDALMTANGFTPEAFEGPQYKVSSDIGNIAVKVVVYGSDANFGITGFNTAQGTTVAEGNVSNIARKYAEYQHGTGQDAAEYFATVSKSDEDED